MVVSKKPEFLVIGGCLRGLSGYLVNFTQSMEEGNWKLLECLFVILSIFRPCRLSLPINSKFRELRIRINRVYLCLPEGNVCS